MRFAVTVTTTVLALVFFAGCGQIVTTQVVETPDMTLDPFATPAPARADIALSGQAVVEHLDDPLEPNDTSEDAYYLGIAPGTADFEAYLDERVVRYDVTVHNSGEGVADEFLVALFVDADEEPRAPANGERAQYVDILGATAKTELSFEVPTTPGTYDSWILADSSDTVAESDELNNAAAVGTLEVTGDEDFFSFYQDATYDISLDLECAGCTGDYDLELLLGSTVVDASRNVSSDESIQVTAPSSGIYRIRVFSYDGTLSSETPYRLRVELQ